MSRAFGFPYGGRDHGHHTLTCMTTLGPYHQCNCPAKDLKFKEPAIAAPYGGSSTPLENAAFQAERERAIDVQRLADAHDPSGTRGLRKRYAEAAGTTLAQDIERQLEKPARHAGAYKHGGTTLAQDIDRLAACHNPEGIQRLSRQSEERSARARAWQASLAKAADLLMREGHAGDAATMNDIARHLTGED